MCEILMHRIIKHEWKIKTNDWNNIHHVPGLKNLHYWDVNSPQPHVQCNSSQYFNSFFVNWQAVSNNLYVKAKELK